MTNIGYRGEDMPESYHGYEVGTFPRKRETPRFRYVCIFSFCVHFYFKENAKKTLNPHLLFLSYNIANLFSVELILCC